jgi:hypothetical protein
MHLYDVKYKSTNGWCSKENGHGLVRAGKWWRHATMAELKEVIRVRHNLGFDHTITIMNATRIETDPTLDKVCGVTIVVLGTIFSIVAGVLLWRVLSSGRF